MEHWIKWWYTSGTRTQKEHWVKNCPGLFNFLLFTFLYSWVVEYIPKWNNMNLFYVWVPIYGAFQFLIDRGFTIFWFAVFVPCHWFKPSKVFLFLLLSVSKLQQAFLYCTIGWWTKSQVLCFLSLGAPFRILSFTNWLQHVIFSQPWDEAIKTKCCCCEHCNSNLYNHERFKKNETILWYPPTSLTLF